MINYILAVLAVAVLVSSAVLVIGLLHAAKQDSARARAFRKYRVEQYKRQQEANQ